MKPPEYPYALCYNKRKGESRLLSRAIHDRHSSAGFFGQPALRDFRHRFPIFIGLWPEGIQALKQANDRKVNYIYIDTAYIRAFLQSKYHRVVVNGLASSQIIPTDSARWEFLGHEVKRWRRGGKHVLVVLQSDVWCESFLGGTVNAIERTLVHQIRQYTDRPIIVRRKPDKFQQHAIIRQDFGVTSLEEDLEDAWCVVGHSSGALCHAVLAGVPVFSLRRSAVTPVSCDDLSKIETPYYPDNRVEWLKSIAIQQWTRDEIRSGALNELWESLEAFPEHQELG